MNSPQRVALALGSAVLVSLMAFAACVESKNGFQFSFWSDAWPERAERTDTRELKLASGQTLRAETPYGEIVVRGTTNPVGSMRAVIHTFGKSVEDARARLERTKVVADETSAGIALRLEVAPDSTTSREPAPTVDFEIEVPAGVALALVSSSGNVRAENGPFGAAQLVSSYGNVKLDHARGAVTATSSSGSVSVAFVDDGALEATSGYGTVSIADVTGTSVSAKSSSGNVRAERIHAKDLTLKSGYGTLTLRDVAVEHDVQAESQSGNVTAEKLEAARSRLASGYGTINVKHSQGELELTTSSGNIAVDEARGALSAKTGYGSIGAEGVFTAVTAQSQSGNVRVRAQSGSAITSGWSLESNYGAVSLDAPKDLRFDLAAKTGYGEVKLGYTVELAPGNLGKDGRSVRGKVNGGGPTVTVESSSGSVSIQPSEH